MLLVCGLDYSGTSLVAGILHHLGVDMGQWDPAPPPLTSAEQALAVAAGGHPRTWASYEDSTVAEQCALAIAGAQPWTREHVADRITEILADYARHHPGAGVKANAACILPSRPEWVTCLIMTRRQERERRRRAAYYRGSLPDLFPHLGEMEGWCLDSYLRLMGQADYVVNFGYALSCPAMLVDDLAAAARIAPSKAQRQAAIASVHLSKRQEVVWHG